MTKLVGPIVFPFTGYGVGGSHISTFLLADALTRDHGVRTVILAVEGSTVEKEARARELEVVVTPGPPAARRETLRDIRRFPARRRLLQSFGADAIVHCCDLWSIQSWGIAAQSIGLPLVYHQRAFITAKPQDRLLVRMAQRVISISQACTDNLEAAGIPGAVPILNPFEMIPDPAEFTNARAEFEQRWPVNDLRLIGFSANFQRRKRARWFIEVAADDAGHGEILRRWGGGRLVPRDADAAAFAAAVTGVLADPAAALDATARARVATELLPATHAGHVLNVYRSIKR